MLRTSITSIAHRQALALLGLLVMLFSTAAMAGQIMVTDIKGRVTNLTGQVIEILAELELDTTVKLDKNAALTLVYLKDGTEYQLKGASEVVLAASGPKGGKVSKRSSLLAAANPVNGKGQKLAQGAILMQLFSDNSSKQKVQGAIVMRDPGDASDWMLPKEKTLSPNPVFEWPASANKQALTLFQLFETESMMPVFGTSLNGNRLTLPKTIKLQAGKRYTWSIQLRDGDTVGPEWRASFSLASTEEMAYFEQIRPEPYASFSDRLLYAHLLQKAQFVGDAKRYWQKLAHERPNLTPLEALAAP